MGLSQRLVQLAKKLGRATHAAYYSVPGLHRTTQPLLVLGHMRCGSTLLAHLLNSHPEMAGYGETHRSYQRLRDFWGLRAHVYVRQPTLRIRARYVTDKNVNSVFPVDPVILGQSSAKVVLIAREPVASLGSLLRILPDWSEEQALEHYVERVELLRRVVTTVGAERSFFLTHHQLIHASASTLHGLTEFLGLQSPLKETYEPTATTGQWGWGDTTERIWSGKIVREHDQSESSLGAQTERKAEEAYRETVTVLASRAQHAQAPFEPTGEVSHRAGKLR